MKLRAKLRIAARTAILEAAEKVFAREGASGARVEHIAEAAEVAVGTLYNHFGDRRGLLDALITARREELLVALDLAMAQTAGQPFVRRLEAFFGAALDHFERHRAFFVVAFDAAQPQSLVQPKRSLLRELHARAQGLVKEGTRSKELRAEYADVSPVLIVGILRALASSAALSPVRGVPENGAALAARLSNCFLEGAASR